MNPALPAGTIPGSGSVNPPPDRRGAAGSARETFRKFASMTAASMGSPSAFMLALASIILWAALGPHYQYSNTWQLVINTGTTIITFLMVFVIQNAQNRDARAIQLKLDELIRANGQSRNRLIDLENCTEEEIAKLEREFQGYRQRQPLPSRPAGAE